MSFEVVRLSAIVRIGGGAAVRDRVGPYRLLERVGAGAYAVVYRARHELMGVERAVKVPRRPAAASAAQPERFLREARVAARLRHANVVCVHDCGTGADGTPYIVMEYVAGCSLAERLRRGVPPAGETLWVACQLADALDHAHALGIVHRDVKPANVLLGVDRAVRLGDFGIAQLGTDDEAGPGPGLGTPAYMAPEQYLGPRGATGPRSDVYSLATVVYEMLTGRTPYGYGGAFAPGRDAPQPPAPCAVNPYLPGAVDEVMARGLARDPDGRPRTAGALVAELAAAVGAAQVPASGEPGSGAGREGEDAATSPPPLPREPVSSGAASVGAHRPALARLFDRVARP